MNGQIHTSFEAHSRLLRLARVGSVRGVALFGLGILGFGCAVAYADPGEASGREQAAAAVSEPEGTVARLGSLGKRIHDGPADGTSERPYQVPLASSLITVDGLLEEPAWRDALVLELPYEFWPANNTPAPVRTEVLVTFDDHSFFVGFRAHDPEPDRIPAHLSDRDDIARDDQVGFEIDTFNDERRSYSIFINPLGVQEDAVSTADGFDFAWDTLWEAETCFHSWGYSTEIEIPFSSIRFQRSAGTQVWGFNAMRAWVRDKRYQLGVVPIDRDNSCGHCQLLKIEGFEGVTPGADLELIPTVTMAGGTCRDDFPYGAMESRGEEVDGGLTAHWGVTPTLTLSGTVNPDFSQVEADALQVDINEPFALFYDEKRPFFSEGADFFETRMDIVHTRTMRDPTWGIKLSGKEGTHTLGAYVVEDEVTSLVLPGSLRSSSLLLDGTNTSSIVRYAKDIGADVTVGAILTSREGEDYFNRVAGIDAAVRLSDADTIIAQAVRSSSRLPQQLAEQLEQPAGTFDASALELFYEHSTRSIRWWASYEDVGEDFRADLGFVPRVGFREREAGLRYTWWAESGRWWSRFDVGVETEHSDDHDGALLRRNSGVWFRYSGTLQSWAFIGAWQGRESHAGQEFAVDDLEISGSLRPVSNLELRVNSWLGQRIDYGSARLGERTRVAPRVNWKVNRHLALDLQTTLERMTVDGQRRYEAGVSQLTVAYQFNVRTFVRAIVQHVDYDYLAPGTAKSATPSEDRKLLSQLLFSYKINPRSVLFLGYTENALGNHEYDLTAADRTLFLKVGYSLPL